MFLFIIKHFICDWLLQNNWIANNKATNPMALLLHCFINGVGTVIVVLIITFDFRPALLLGLFEFSFHLVVDKIKLHIPCERFGRRYWIILGTDQSLHYMSYYLIIKLIGG